MNDRLIEKVRALPEVYQPIFGHPELAENVSRQCEDRLQYIGALHDALREKLGRSVRVLDLGCAQGYICLSLAARGACVTGVDFLQGNIDVCRALAAEHPEFDVGFEYGRLETCIEHLEENAFDLVLGLSVFHHVVHEFGVSATRRWMKRLASCVAMGVFELAQAGEPLYWGASQPEDARELLAGFPFVHELARFPTHLSDIQRPLYVCSARYWYLDGQIHRFERSETDSHVLARGTHHMSRRYLFGDGRLAKLLRFDGERGSHNRTEWQREVDALSNLPGELKGRWPTLESHGHGTDEGWLVRSAVEGELLLDVIQRGDTYDPRRVIGDVLEQLAILERHGRYHNDLRVWNALLTQTGNTLLIDYGAISDEPVGSSWPDDLFLAFFTFVHEVATHSVYAVAPYVVPPFISPLNIPEPYADWLAPFWSGSRQAWTFQGLLDAYAKIEESGHAEPVHSDARQLWMSTIERHLAGVGHQVFCQDSSIGQLRKDVAQHGSSLGQLQQDDRQRQMDLRHAHERFESLDGAISRLNESLGALLASTQHEKNLASGRLDRDHARMDALEKEVNCVQKAVEQLHLQWLASDQERQRTLQQLELVCSSRSFRITRPLRLMAHGARKARSLAGRIARPIWHRMVRHAWGRRIGKMLFYPFPALRMRLNKSIIAHVGYVVGAVPPPVQDKCLSPGAERIYQQLQSGMESARPRKGV